MERLMYIFSNAVCVYALYVFISTFLGESKLSGKWKTAVYLLYLILGSILWLSFPNSLCSLLLNTVPVLLLTFLHRSTWKARLICSASCFAAGTAIDKISYWMFGQTASYTCGLVQVTFALTLALLLKWLHPKDEDIFEKLPYAGCLIATAVGTVTIGLLSVHEDTVHDYAVAALLLFINLLICYYVTDLEQKNLETKNALHIAETSCHAYQNQLALMAESQQKLRFVRHDLKQHMFRIRDLVRSGDAEKLSSYLNDMEDAVDVSQIYARTGNRDVDSLINYELGRAAELGTKISCEIELPAELNVNTFDLTVILGNLLENAIDALQYAEQRRLILVVRERKEIIRIEINNTCNGSHRKPSDGKEHGIGLLSVRSALHKYHGDLRFFPSESEYRTTATFFNMSSTKHSNF